MTGNKNKYLFLYDFVAFPRSEIKLVGKEILLEKVNNLLKQQSTIMLDADEDDVENNPIWQNI